MTLMIRPRFDLDWPDSLLGMASMPDLKVEEFQTGGKLIVRAELPGIDPDKDIEITLSDHTLRIRAERRQESKVEDAKGYRSEFSYGSFTRSIQLPAGATKDDVTATYKDGILEVQVPIDGSQAAETKVPVTHS